MNVWVPISPILFPFSLYRSPLYSLSTYIIVLSRSLWAYICEANLHVIYIAKFFIVIRHIAKYGEIIIMLQ